MKIIGKVKLRNILHGSLVLMLWACAHNQASKIKSGWHPLTKAKEIDCVDWPLREKDLKIEGIETFFGDPRGFFVSVTRRDASNGYYFAPFEQGLLPKSERFASVSLPRGSRLVGGAMVDGKPHAMVLTVETNRVKLESRSLDRGLIDQRLPIPMVRGFERGQMIPGVHGDWLLLEDDEGRHRVYFQAVRANGQSELRDLHIDLEEPPKAIFFRDGLLLAYRSSKQPRLLKTIWISERTSASPEPSGYQASTVDTGENIEAWNVASSPKGVIFAGIIGDSLVGEARMSVGVLDLSNKNGQLQLIGRADLRDIHVAAPVILATAEGIEVLLVNWVDEESTIARYIVNAQGLSRPVFTGLFANGAHIVGYLTSKDARQVRVLTRHRIESRWAYQICGL